MEETVKPVVTMYSFYDMEGCYHFKNSGPGNKILPFNIFEDGRVLTIKYTGKTPYIIEKVYSLQELNRLLETRAVRPGSVKIPANSKRGDEPQEQIMKSPDMFSPELTQKFNKTTGERISYI